MSGVKRTGAVLTIYKPVLDVSYSGMHHRQSHRRRRRKRVGTRPPHRTGTSTLPVQMSLSFGVLTDRLDSPFTDIEYIVRPLLIIRSVHQVVHIGNETHEVTLPRIGIHVYIRLGPRPLRRYLRN